MGQKKQNENEKHLGIPRQIQDHQDMRIHMKSIWDHQDTMKMKTNQDHQDET